MSVFAVLRPGLTGISSIPRDSLLRRQKFLQSNPVVATVNTQRHFGVTSRTYFPRKNRAVTEEEWTITPEELKEERKLVESVRRGIWAGQSGGMFVLLKSRIIAIN